MHILVAQPVDPDGLAELRTLDATIEIIDPFGPDHVLSPNQAVTTEILFADLPPANIAEMRALRWMQLGSHGYAQFIGQHLPAGVTVCNASGVNDIPIAEWCVLMMLAFERGLTQMLAEQRAHRWNRDAKFQAELRGRRVGIFGYGNIGQELARRSHALGLEVWAMSRFRPGGREHRYHPVTYETPTPDPHRVFAMDQRREFLAGLDYLAITVPATGATRGYFDAEALAELPRHAVLLNPARAQVVDEPGLIDALRSGTLAGAALDDHYRQPMPADDPFWDLPNTIVSAHVSGSTASTYYLPRIWKLFNQNVQRHLAQDPLLNVIAAADLELGPQVTS